ncbi:hypothetical protein [Deinococcus sonorensis]|uniref:Uncharacterized protein n=1 Tax=Deinococcus sonorensis TaxID=309891 RepID=A0ABV8YA49_9DEIO
MPFLQVIELSASGVPVGIVDRQWAYLSHDGAVLFLDTPTPRPLFLVTILEWRETLMPTLAQGLQACGLDPALAATFPVDRGVRMGLTWGTAYWEALAIGWVTREASAPRFLLELQVLTTQGSTQRIRHTARRLAQAATRTSSMSSSG